jgi:hypothetical protein
MGTKIFTLDFLAPVPAGNGVLFASLRRDGGALRFVLDRGSSIMYGDEVLWDEFPEEAEIVPEVVSDPVTALSARGWVLKASVEGVSGGALVSTSNSGDRNHSKTHLVIVMGPPGVYR